MTTHQNIEAAIYGAAMADRYEATTTHVMVIGGQASKVSS